MYMLVQISKLRANKSFSVTQIDGRGVTVHSKKSLSVSFPSDLHDAVQVGSIWEIKGEQQEQKFVVNGFTVTEDHIVANEATFVKPNTALIETWLRKNIDGVGTVKAKKLARMPLLVRAIESGDPTNFLDLNETARNQLFSKFPRDGYAEAIDWLSRRNLPVKLANSISAVWREKTIELLEDNPFRLMQFNVSFKQCCAVAAEFGFDVKHPKYKAALAVNIINEYTKKTASTFMPRKAFEQSCVKRRIDYKEALKFAADQELIGYLKEADGYQLEGQYLLEAMTGNRLRNAFLRADGDMSEIAGWEKAVSDKEISYHLHNFEQNLPYSLTDEQRAAVAQACKWKVISLSGGAGTGKTTVLNAVLSVLEAVSLDTPVYQVALSGRASQRMSEATGRPASTIAKFCIDMKNEADDKRPDHCICVIDEASMVDLFSMHNLLQYLPQATRFIFVGDVDQLPPVGGGLIFHNLMKSDFPSVTLTAVKRQGEQSGIHRFATTVRNEVDYDVDVDNYAVRKESDCSILNSINPAEITALFTELGGSKNGVVLTATQKGAAGVLNLNNVMQKEAGYDRPRITIDAGDGVYDFINAKGNKFYLNDPILINKNDYGIGIRNGDLGFIETIYDEATHNGEGICYGVLNLDGRKIDITDEVLDKIDLGYAITIHKSQGSQWENVILILDEQARRMLDKTLLYTGVTRAEKKLVMCCENLELIEDAVARGSIAQQRNTNLLQHLNTDF
jgi:exodeoxyribonuclease V alpha subunit